MEWADLNRLDELLLGTKKGATIEKIGCSEGKRPLYAVTVGDEAADTVIVAIAGMHANEVAAPLALVALIHKLVRQTPERVRYHFVPISDPDLLAQNAQQLCEPITVPKLLSLTVRDLEGNFTSNRYPECLAIREWLENLPRIDAFFSLHTAPRVTPGLFFYVAGTSRDCIASVAERMATCCPSQIPLLESDPSGFGEALFRGFFPIPSAAQMNDYDRRDRSGTSIEFVAQRFQPSFIGVSEIPLGLCTELHNAPIEEIEQFNKKLAQTAKVDFLYQELALQTQIDLLHNFVQAPEPYLLKRKQVN